MLFENLQAGWKAIRNHRYHSILNIIGFAFALSVVILLGMYVRRELTTNLYHKNVERIYKISGWGTPYPLASLIREGIPEVEALTVNEQYQNSGFIVQIDAEREVELPGGILRTDNDFFDVFTFPIVAGNRQTPLPDYQSIVLTQSAAQLLFPGQDPIGKTLFEGALTVTAVVADIPENSSIRFSAVVALNPNQLYYGQKLSELWGRWYFEIHARLAPGIDQEAVNKKLEELVEKDGRLKYEAFRVKLYPFDELYFNPGQTLTSFAGGDRNQVRVMTWIGIFILLLAVVNFLNLATASGMTRSREIGLRKVNGATRWAVVGQFLMESIVITFVAMCLALLLVELLLPIFGKFMGGVPYEPIHFQHGWHWVLLIGGTVAVGTIAGSYPAFYLSCVDPINALYTGRVRTGLTVVALRRVLIVFQLVVSIVMISATFIIRGQLNYLRTAPTGFDKEQVLLVNPAPTIWESSGNNYETFLSKWQAFTSELRNLPSVEGITYTSDVVGMVNAGTEIKGDYHGEEKQTWVRTFRADTAVFRVLGLELVAGRIPYAHEREAVVINEQAVRSLGIEDPLEFRVEMGQTPEGTKLYQPIVGVVKDFNFAPLKEGINALVIGTSGEMTSGMVNVRIGAASMADIERVVNDITAVYQQFDPEGKPNLQFLNELLSRSYESEARFQRSMMILAALAIVISCFGLFGLIIFSNARRRKEIGVRKVQGATVGQVIGLLIRGYLLYVAIAFAVATPITYYIMRQWLQGYPYKVGMHWWYFALGGLVALAVVTITVGLQSWRAATTNPVKSLKTE